MSEETPEVRGIRNIAEQLAISQAALNRDRQRMLEVRSLPGYTPRKLTRREKIRADAREKWRRSRQWVALKLAPWLDEW